MARKSFFEALHREINFEDEYSKIERMVYEERPTNLGSIGDVIDKRFRDWNHRGNYISFNEVRNHLGFPRGQHKISTIYDSEMNMDRFLLYCDMMLNIFDCISHSIDYSTHRQLNDTIVLIHMDLDYLHFEARTGDDNRVYIVQKDAAASAVLDIVDPSMVTPILSYNHFLLRGDVDKKRALLNTIANDLEGAKEAKLSQLNNSALRDNLFFMFNNMQIRHNNIDPSNKSKYNPRLAAMSQEEIELWYDETYQMALYSYLILDNQERQIRVASLKP